MNTICAWCQAEGKPGLLHTIPPVDDPSERLGICWEHRIEALATARSHARYRRAEQGPGVLLIVGHPHSRLFPRFRVQFLDDPRVRVLLDRRVGERRRAGRPHAPDRRRAERRHLPDYWEDLRYHPVVLVPTAERPAAPPEAPPGPGADPRTIALLTQHLDPLGQWLDTGHALLDRVIRHLTESWADLRRRVETAEDTARQLRQALEERGRELARLQAEVERLNRERAVVAEALGTRVGEIDRLMRRAIDTLRRVSRPPSGP